MNMSLKAACAAAAISLISAAHAAQTGPFFSVSAGGNIVDDFDLGGGSHFELDPGFRFDGSVGYNFYANPAVVMGAAFEVGFMFNAIDEQVAPNGTTTPIDGDLYQNPFLAKLTFRFLPDQPFNPFLSIGGGGVYTATEVRRIGGTPTFLEGDEVDAAVQGSAGVKFRLNDTMNVGLAYKCLVAFPDGYDEVINHSFLAAFSMSF